MSIHGISNAKRYVNKTGANLGKEFQKTLINRTRILSQQMQQGINDSVDRGAVAFTKRAILFTYTKTGFGGVRCTILVKKLQAQYLYNVIVDSTQLYDKFIPTSAARLSREGNILGLRNNLRKGRYKVVKQGGKERLIDTKQKKKDKRVIGLREEKRRKMVYDFYTEAEAGARMIISDVRGVFKVSKG
ncbi:TPA: hypothetical protein JG946_003771 [Enterobacter hormaechei subsp. steigerwaltii]|nr:hypothetical protein [Enterobacter hormaechei subsp. steigerwaltii]